MFIFKIFTFSSLFFFCLCDQRLLIDELRWNFLELEDRLWNFSANGLLYKSQEAVEVYLASQFHTFDQKLNQMPQDPLSGVEPLRTLPEFLFLFSDLKIIEIRYDKFRDYQNQQLTGSPQKVAIEDLINDILHNRTGVQATMDRIYARAYEDENNIVYGLRKMIADNYWLKNTKQSPQQLIYNTYNLIALHELKAYVLQQFAHLGNRIWNKGNNVDLSISARKTYETRVKRTMSAIVFSVILPRDIWRCDPKAFIKGVNYDEFTRLIQGHIQNEVDMSSKRTCRSTCNGYSFTSSYGCYDYKSDYCKKVEKCTGKIISCFFVEAHASICLSDRASRRYEFIRYKSGKVYGKDGYCSNKRSVNSWTRWFVRCHYCMCLCDETGPLSDRYINLRPVIADVQNNRVVTGLRLIKHNRILHLQIQEGKLLPYGYINQSTVHWVKIEDYKITGTYEGKEIREGIDFFKMSYGNSAMALDGIQVHDDNHVVTGLRFQYINGKIHLQIHVSPFNWHTGAVNQQGSYYIFESSIKSRMKIGLKKSDIPTKTTSPSLKLFTGADTYVEFTHSDFDKDAAQTTIPYIDVQDVISDPAVPLVGAGIYYRGNPGFGGFIAPQIQTYNYVPHYSKKLPAMVDRPDFEEEEDSTVAVELN